MRAMSRRSAALIVFVALGLGVSASHANRQGPRAARKPNLPTAADLQNKIQSHQQNAQNSTAQFQAAYSKAASSGDRGTMEQAVGLRANALRAQLDALRTQAYHAGKFGGKEGKAQEAELRKQVEVVRAELRQVRSSAPQIAQAELSALKQEMPKAPAQRLGWKDARALYAQHMAMKDYTKAADALKQMEGAVGGGLTGRWQKFQLGRDRKALLKANKQLAKTILTDTLHGKLDYSKVRDALSRMEREAKQGNFISRAYKGAKLALTRRRIRQAVEQKMVRAVRGGEVGMEDADLLRAYKDGTLGAQIKQGWAEHEQAWIAERANPVLAAAAQQGMDPGSPEVQNFLAQEHKQVRRGYFRDVRANLKRSNFVQGLQILDHLGAKEKAIYTQSKGTRGFVNRQVRRFSSWVLGSPLRSKDKAEGELVKQADFLSKKSEKGRHLSAGERVNMSLQAHALLLTAKQLKVGETKAFEKTRSRAIKRVQKSISEAVKAGDPASVAQAYGLYEAYGMDNKGREWGGPKTMVNFQRDLTTAQRKLVSRASAVVRKAILNPKQLAVIGAHPGIALEINAFAAAMAQQFAEQNPGVIPEKLWKQIEFNRELIDGRSAKAKATKFWHSGWNPLSWPLRVGKFILAQPVALVKPHQVPKLATELQDVYGIMQKYMEMQQAQMQMAGPQMGGVSAPQMVVPPPGANVAPPPVEAPSSGGGAGASL